MESEMNPGDRPSQRLRLLPVSVGWLVGSVLLSLMAVSIQDGADSGVQAALLMLAGVAKVVGIMTLGGYLLARILEELHLWRSGKAEPTGRDWYEA